MASCDQLSEDDLATVSGQLREIVRENGWSRTLAIGNLIVDRLFFGNSEGIGVPQDTGKHPSIRRLAAREDCPLKKTALAQAMGVYAVVQQEPHWRSAVGITPAHVAVVVSLPAEQRREMLLRAEAEKWSVRVLAQTTRQARESTDPARNGRSPPPGTLRQALNLYRAGLRSMQDALRLMKHNDGMSLEVANELAGMLRALGIAVGESGDALRALKRAGGLANVHHNTQPFDAVDAA